MSLKVTNKFGKLTAEELSVGELVYWYNWNPGNYEFERVYGILTGTKEVESNGGPVDFAGGKEEGGKAPAPKDMGVKGPSDGAELNKNIRDDAISAIVNVTCF
mgnify:CR=1 FL=1